MKPLQVNPLTNLEEEAKSNKYLDQLTVSNSSNRKVIYDGDTPVGFFNPRPQSFKGKQYWRAGAVYVKQDSQGKGLATNALKDFYEGRRGIAWIDQENTASKALFSKIGFQQDKPLEVDGSQGHWYIKHR